MIVVYKVSYEMVPWKFGIHRAESVGPYGSLILLDKDGPRNDVWITRAIYSEELLDEEYLYLTMLCADGGFTLRNPRIQALTSKRWQPRRVYLND